MTSRVVEVALPNGTVALVRATELDGGGGPAEKVGFKDAFDFNHVAATLEGISEAIRSSLDKARPNRTTVELGIELAVKAGALSALVVDANGSASLKVTLEWAGEPKPTG
jgi:hypothetical protein